MREVLTTLFEMGKNIFEVIQALTGEQIALISVFVSFIIYTLGKQNELKMKKHEAKKEQYIKFIKLLEKVFKNTKKSKGKLATEVEKDFFDLGSSLLLYGSKKLYKKYVFYREFSINPLVTQNKYYNDRLGLYILADMFKIMRKEVGLNTINNISNVEALGFFINNIANNPNFKIESYKAKYQLFMIRVDLFFFDRYFLVFLKKAYYIVFAPILGLISAVFKYFIVIPVTKIMIKINPNIENDLVNLEQRFNSMLAESREE